MVFDKKKIFFYYKLLEERGKKKTKERVNLKEIVKDLSQTLGLKIEFIQVGFRGDAKVTGGLGNCGQHLCCANWLHRPKQITVKMAKEQGLPINIQKISGVCGRLQCCLHYEVDLYTDGKLNDILQKEQKEDVDEYLQMFSEDSR